MPCDRRSGEPPRVEPARRAIAGSSGGPASSPGVSLDELDDAEKPEAQRQHEEQRVDPIEDAPEAGQQRAGVLDLRLALDRQFDRSPQTAPIATTGTSSTIVAAPCGR